MHARFRRPMPSCSCCHLCRSLAFWIPSPSYAGVASFAQALILPNEGQPEAILLLLIATFPPGRKPSAHSAHI